MHRRLPLADDRRMASGAVAAGRHRRLDLAVQAAQVARLSAVGRLRGRLVVRGREPLPGSQPASGAFGRTSPSCAATADGTHTDRSGGGDGEARELEFIHDARFSESSSASFGAPAQSSHQPGAIVIRRLPNLSSYQMPL